MYLRLSGEDRGGEGMKEKVENCSQSLKMRYSPFHTGRVSELPEGLMTNSYLQNPLFKNLYVLENSTHSKIST